MTVDEALRVVEVGDDDPDEMAGAAHTLAAEVKRLRAETSSAAAEVERLHADAATARATIDLMREENARLKAERAELQWKVRGL